MKLIIDSADATAIEKYNQFLPVAGVTTNPSILKKEGEISVIERMHTIQSILGKGKDIHVQVVAQNFDDIIKDAHRIIETLGEDTFIKIPVNQAGLQAIKYLKKEGRRITATGIYTKMQCYLSIEFGADFLAPYVNRIQNLDADPFNLIQTIATHIQQTGSKTQLLAASFKNVGQVTAAIEAGANYVTVGPDIIDKFLDNANINKAVNDFSADWYAIHNNYAF